MLAVAQDLRASVGLTVLGVAAVALSRRLLHRVAVRVERVPAVGSEDDTIVVQHLTMFGRATKTYRRQGGCR